MTARPIILVAGSLLAVTLANDAWAQPRPPGTVQPGGVERQFERPPEPTAKDGVITIPGASQQAPANAEGIRFVVNQLTIDGATVYPAETLRGAYAHVLGKEVTLGEIYRIVNALTARYRNDGYILSQVIVPAQSVEGGNIRLQAVEGYIADVRVEGGTAAMRARVQKYGNKIQASRPLTAGALERYVLLLNDIPGVQARAVLAPAQTSGASDLVLQVSQRRTAAQFATDNRGSRAQGRSRVSGDADFHSLFGGASVTEVRGVTSLNPELFFLAASHEQLVGTEGGRFNVSGSLVYTKPQELAFIPLELTTESQTLAVGYTHPLFRSRGHNVYLRGMLTAFNSTSQIFGVDDTVDHIRAIRAGVTYDSSDALGGLNIVDFEFSQGLAALGASANDDPYLSRYGGKADFSKVTAYGARIQTLSRNWSLLAGVNAQYAFTDLLAPELFAVGGEHFGRGYDPSEILNDHGAALKLDLRYNHVWGGRRSASITPYGFVDMGQVWQRTTTPGFESSQSLVSTGGGIWLHIGTQVSGYIEVAKPLTKDVLQEKNRDPRIFAGITVQ